jgi:uncharacterized protein YbjT (DUF2867 family)
MDKHGKTILVTGATGRQGGATARRLMEDGWSVRAMTRDLSKPAARELSLLGAQVVQGDMGDADSVARAVKGCHGLFSVQDFSQAGLEGEVRQGKLLADAARSAGVSHFVYTSVGAANQNTGIPHFETKARIEEHVRATGLRYTIIRPVFFMDNFLSPGMRDGIIAGRLSLPIRSERPLQMIAVRDIGQMAATAFADTDRYGGRAIDLAGDELTLPHACRILSSAIGHEVRYEEANLADMERSSPEMGKMFRWFNERGYSVDIHSLRAILPRLSTFEAWAAEVFALELAVAR